MAWTAPATATANAPLPSATWNATVRDNFNETGPAKATTVGGYFVVTSANRIVERVGQRETITTEGDTTSTSYTDLSGTFGPEVTVTTGELALALWTSQAINTTANNSTRVSVEVSGASNSSPSDIRALAFDPPTSSAVGQAAMTVFYDDLTGGENIFTMKYRVGGGRGFFKWRRLIVIPY